MRNPRCRCDPGHRDGALTAHGCRPEGGGTLFTLSPAAIVATPPPEATSAPRRDACAVAASGAGVAAGPGEVERGRRCAEPVGAQRNCHELPAGCHGGAQRRAAALWRRYGEGYGKRAGTGTGPGPGGAAL